MMMSNTDPDPDDDARADDGDDAAPAVKSKSQLKREHLAVQALAARLAELAPRRLETLGLGADTYAAVVEARNLERGARKRQLRYAGALLAREDVAAIETQLVELGRPHAKAVQEFHAAEAWRDALLDGQTAVIDELATRYPALDRNHLGKLAGEARRERDAGRPPRAARLLFRYLKEISSA